MKLQFMGKQQEVADVWSYVFEPVEPLQWAAGQSIRFELARPTYGTDERRFTISSAPYENHVTITTRLSDSSFKKSLDALVSGQLVDAYNVEGTFVWGESTEPRIFIAGGIGITPFHSMLKQCTHDKQPLNATLLYRSKGDEAVFETWLSACHKEHSDFTIEHYKDERVTAKDVAALPDWQQSLVYISGPSKMVESLSAALRELGLPEDNIKRDLFTGNIEA